MLAQVEVGAAVNTFHLLEAEWHLEFDVGSGVGVVSKLLVVVEAILLIAHAQSLVPFQTRFLPLLEPFEFIARAHEELHFHLLKFTHTENELASHNLVAESLADLCNTERNLHAACLLHVQIVHEDTLCCLRTQIYLHRCVGRCTHLG